MSGPSGGARIEPRRASRSGMGPKYCSFGCLPGRAGPFQPGMGSDRVLWFMCPKGRMSASVAPRPRHASPPGSPSFCVPPMLNPTLFQSVPASVLVIEDSMDVADSLARFLRVGTGHDVRVAYDGLSGIRMAVAEVPEAVVCDIAMPKVDGLTVARELAELTP